MPKNQSDLILAYLRDAERNAESHLTTASISGKGREYAQGWYEALKACVRVVVSEVKGGEE